MVSVYYPDKPSALRAFPGGLEAELGGPNALPVSKIAILALKSCALLMDVQARRDDEEI